MSASNTASGKIMEDVSLTRRIKILIDKKHESMKEWKFTVTIPCYIDSVYSESVNVNEFVGSNRKEKVKFCSQLYPVTLGCKGEGWKKLKKDLQHAAIVGGFALYGNGPVQQKSVKTPMYIMKCSHGRLKKVTNLDVENRHRKEFSLNNKKCGRREDGKSVP